MNPPRTSADILPPAALAVLWALLVLCIAALVAMGCFLIAHSLVIMPREYDQLSTHGVPVTARVVDCRRGKRLCDLAYSYAGTPPTVVYTRNTAQFGDPGSTVDMLVDPSDPSMVFTAKDVSNRYREPYEIPLGLGILVVTLGLVGLVVRAERSARTRAEHAPAR